MWLLDYSDPDPATNLALDEALLESAEAASETEPTPATEVLRFWESSVHYAVLGAGSPAHADLNLDACRADSIPILRRTSGGGTVLQGPGCLNYALVLDSAARRDQVGTIDKTNTFVLARVIDALTRCGLALPEQIGTSDLRAADRKFSGNAQRRKRRHILFHGTILYNFDLTLIPRYLAEPRRQPDWRAHRPHVSFVSNVPLNPAQFRREMCNVWHCSPPATASNPQPIPTPLLLDRARRIIGEKIGRGDWTYGI